MKETIQDLKQQHSEAIYKHLLPTWTGNGKNVRCFAHEDNNPSLSIFQKAGEYRHYCHSCKVSGDCLDLIGSFENTGDATHQIGRLKEIAGITESKKKIEPPKKQKHVSLADIQKITFDGYSFDRLHTYKAGNPPYIKVIFKNSAGDKKGLFYSVSDNGLYVSGRKSDPVFYNQELITDNVKSVFISESEKDCDTLLNVCNFLCISTGGATSWSDKLPIEILRDKAIILLPHHDLPGREYAKTAAQSLRSIAASIKIIELPGLKEKGDVSDWLQARQAEGKTAEGIKTELRAIVKNAPEYDVSSFLDIGGGHMDTWLAEPFAYLKRGADLQTLDIKIEWLIDKLLPKESITLLHGKGGIGKTWVCLILADCISRGLPFMGLDTQTLSVIFVDFENSLPVLVDRVRKIGIDDVLFWHNADTELKPPKIDKEDWERYKALPPGSLLIFDTLRASQSLDENDSRQMAFVMSRLKELRDMGFTILLLHHTPKGNDRTYKGSTAIPDLADHVLSLHKVKKGNPEGGEVEDEDDTDCLYRLGTKDKTRYEPFHVFMAFDKVKGFVKAEDPAEGDLKEIYNILKEHSRLNQITIFESAKNELDIKSKGKVTNLLKKGEGKYWTACREGKAVYYEALPCVQLSTPIYAEVGQINNVSRTERTDALFDTPQTLDASHVSNCPAILQTDRTDTLFVDAEAKPVQLSTPIYTEVGQIFIDEEIE